MNERSDLNYAYRVLYDQTFTNGCERTNEHVVGSPPYDVAGGEEEDGAGSSRLGRLQADPRLTQTWLERLLSGFNWFQLVKKCVV